MKYEHIIVTDRMSSHDQPSWGRHRSFCLKCERTFMINIEWASGTYPHYYSLQLNKAILNTAYNIRNGKCAISDGDYKMRELLK